MAKVTIYTTQICPYCHSAKALLRQKHAAFEEIDVMATPGAREEMIARTRRRTVPQIFIGATHVGGCDDLHALDRAGRLDSLLTGEA